MNKGLRNVLHWLNLWHMGIMWVIAILLSYFKLLFYSYPESYVLSPHSAFTVNQESGPVACIITGASSGIGKAAAEALALKGYHVILAGHSMASLHQVAEELQRHHKSIMVEVLVVDVSSTDSIIRFVETVAKLVDDKSLSLQLLINNAGILATTERITAEGYDRVADPGIVHTAIFRELPRWFSTCIFLLLRCTWLLQSSEVGCRAVVDAALAPLGCSAKYFFGGQGRVLASSPLSCNKQLANDLWILSERLFSDTILGTTIGCKNSVL